MFIDKEFITISIIVLLVVLFTISLNRAYGEKDKKNKQEKKQLDLEKELWLKNTNEKEQIYCILVETKSGKLYRSEPFNHTAEVRRLFGKNRLVSKTSEEHAKIIIKNAFEKKMYYDKGTKSYIPVNEVERFRIVKV